MPFKKGHSANPNLHLPRKKPNPPNIDGLITKNGRPPSYKDTFPELIKRLRLLMKTREEIATFFGVSICTIDLWIVKYPDFKHAYDEGGEKADAEIIAALAQRAKGYSHSAVKIFMPQGATEPVYAPYVEHYPPDTAAAGLWLSNRQRGKWSLKAWSNKDEEPEGGNMIRITGGLPDE